MTSNDDPLLSKLDEINISIHVREIVVGCFWQVRTGIEMFDAYFCYFQRCCSGFFKESYTDSDLHLSQVLDVVSYLQQNMNIPRDQIFDNFDWTSNGARGWYANLEVKDGVRPAAFLVLDFCILLWLTIDMKHQYVADVGYQRFDMWSKDLTLNEVLKQRAFPEKRASLQETPRWPNSLSALNLHRIGQFKIVWVDNILDHLVIDTEPPRISIYHHATVLLALQNSAVREAFPDNALEETMQTLALLLPKYNQSSSRWFLREHNRARKFGGYLDLDARIQSLQLHGRESGWYNFWGERLSLIQSAFDQTEPNSFTQWWYDTRHAERRTTFWIGMSGILLAVLLGLIQSIAGIWQVVLIYKRG